MFVATIVSVLFRRLDSPGKKAFTFSWELFEKEIVDIWSLALEGIDRTVSAVIPWHTHKFSDGEFAFHLKSNPFAIDLSSIHRG
mgnify:CR=1 FL=1